MTEKHNHPPQKRTHSIRFRVTPSEKQEILLRADGKELATWLRSLSLGQKLPSRSYPNVDPNVVREIARIGNNLNQIARSINSELSRNRNKSSDLFSGFDYLVVLREIHEELRALREDLSCS